MRADREVLGPGRVTRLTVMLNVFVFFYFILFFRVTIDSKHLSLFH